ncbi:ATP synthase subunit ATP5MPL, mitochondrial-like [Cricetulus griseus]|uniref:ATP synthase subunit ATP5MPL, mitochondrial-like n=1 Tax=Cricetulus griseus TaxID=10029 RepID=A0A9J7KC42_CRIGR|nr:ATP synthase subunit ATP5MPL, mitochondrial-like [Cricetulus griseus]XP_035305979.1 ATP synthase subunit ATP5MPL, mitochondrial-like [Cricetulus griseus]
MRLFQSLVNSVWDPRKPYFTQLYLDIWVAMELMTFISCKIRSAHKTSKALKGSIPSHGHY